jgi:hypothetical protein
MREISVLGDAYPHIDRDRLFAFCEEWSLVNWRVIDQRMPENDLSDSELAQQSTPASGSCDQPSAERRIRRDAPIAESEATIIPSQQLAYCAYGPCDRKMPRESKTRRESKAAKALAELFMDPQVTPPSDPFDTSIWDTQKLPSEERFMPPTLWFAAEKARALATLAESAGFSPHSLAGTFALTARVFGFTDWYELERMFSKGRRSLFDEEIPHTTSRRRHEWQVHVLESCLNLPRAVAVGIRLDWQPTSRDFRIAEHPQVSYISKPTDGRLESERRIAGTLTLTRPHSTKER